MTENTMTENTTTAAYWSAQLTARLAEAQTAHRERVRHLNRVAQGEERLTEEQRESLKQSEHKSRQLLDEMTERGGVRQRVRVVSMDDVSATREALPKPIVEAYELLFCAAYGSDPAISSGNPTVERSAGRRVTRTSTSTPEGVGGAAKASTKKVGANQRNVIRDRRAYEEKIKVDRRLRRMAKEIREVVLGEVVERTARVCERCARIGEQEWGFCPWCGYRMVESAD